MNRDTRRADEHVTIGERGQRPVRFHQTGSYVPEPPALVLARVVKDADLDLRPGRRSRLETSERISAPAPQTPIR